MSRPARATGPARPVGSGPVVLPADLAEGLAGLLAEASAGSGSWQDDGLCAQVGGDLWFPDKGDPVRPAKSVCARCPVQEQCLQYALEADERFGVWGGLSERERRAMRQAANRLHLSSGFDQDTDPDADLDAGLDVDPDLVAEAS